MTPDERAQYDAKISAVLSAIEARQGERLDKSTPGQSGAGAERFPIDEATIREIVKRYAQQRRPPAGTCHRNRADRRRSPWRCDSIASAAKHWRSFRILLA